LSLEASGSMCSRLQIYLPDMPSSAEGCHFWKLEAIGLFSLYIPKTERLLPSAHKSDQAYFPLTTNGPQCGTEELCDRLSNLHKARKIVWSLTHCFHIIIYPDSEVEDF
jgi:hypothetical protein